MANRRWDKVRKEIRERIEFAAKCSQNGDVVAVTPKGKSTVARVSTYCGRIEIYELAPAYRKRKFVPLTEASRALLKKARRWLWQPAIPRHPLEILALAEEFEEASCEA